MKLYQVTFDATTITVVARDEDQLFEMLQGKDDAFSRHDTDVFFHWGEDYVDKVNIHEVSMEIPIIIQWESH